MASSPSLIIHDQTSSQGFYLCRHCKAHIVPKRANIFTDPVSLVGLFENEVVNVKVAGEERKWHLTSCNYVDVFCLVCETRLGYQMVEVDKEAIDKKGRYCMFMREFIVSKNSAAVDGEKDNQDPADENED